MADQPPQVPLEPAPEYPPPPRQGIDSSTKIVIAIVIGVVLLALLAPVLFIGLFFMDWMHEWTSTRDPVPFTGSAYYYDTVTGDVFTGDADQLPPITSPAGNEAVRVHFYSCGDCSVSARFVGYYEKYSPEAKAKLEGVQASNPDDPAMFMEDEGLLVSMDGKQWFPMYSQQAEAVLSSRLQCTGGNRLRYCHGGSR